MSPPLGTHGGGLVVTVATTTTNANTSMALYLCQTLFSVPYIYMNSILTTIPQARDYYDIHCTDAETEAQKGYVTISTKEKLLLANLHQYLSTHIQATGKPNFSPQAILVTTSLHFLTTHKARHWRTHRKKLDLVVQDLFISSLKFLHGGKCP